MDFKEARQMPEASNTVSKANFEKPFLLHGEVWTSSLKIQQGNSV
jgi:hypothetical protein